jgi:hypothetical protein
LWRRPRTKLGCGAKERRRRRRRIVCVYIYASFPGFINNTLNIPLNNYASPLGITMAVI